MDRSLGSIFTGIGAGDYGLERAGWRVRWQTEPDPFRREVLRRHWPGALRFWDLKACLAFGAPPVDLVYGELPNTDPAWWDEVFPLVEGCQSPLWLLEASPVAFDRPEQADLIRRFGELGYWATTRTIGYASQMRGRVGGMEIICTLKRRRLFLLAGCGGAAKDLETIDLLTGAEPTSLRPHFEERPVLDEVEALIGLPVGWSCLCGSAPCRCAGRRPAVEEATVVHLLEWIGAWLLAY